MTRISSLMTPAPLPIDARRDLREALERMEGLKVRQLPVVDAGRLVGVVSETQILRYLRAEPEAGCVPVSLVMGHPFAVDPGAPAAVVARAMTERGLDVAVVVEDERIAGIFTGTDAVRAFAEDRGSDPTPAPVVSAGWPRKILCAVDFSAGSKEAAHAALDVARLSKAAVTLFHSFDLPAQPLDAGDTGAAMLAPLERETDAMLTVLRAELDRPDGPPLQVAHGLGSAAETIVRHARDHAFDLIVVGTHGRTGLRRVFLGSVAEAVLRHAPCPVLVVKERSPLSAQP
jgi:nucleotide-binding universal stress UspA family protein/CBS domain-containing protein